MLLRLYNWVISWADTKYARIALIINSFSESSFFPIPPDVLLIAMCIARPKKSFLYATLCSISSVLGGIFGYLIGLFFMNEIGLPLVKFYNAEALYKSLQIKYELYNAWIVGIAGFTPIPYKIFTIAAGAFKINFMIFVFASIVSRSARFFLVSFLIYKFGPQVKNFIEKYFNILSIIFVILLILGFILLKKLF